MTTVTFNTKADLNHKIGNYYLCKKDKCIYILSLIEADHAALISLADGIRYVPHERVYNACKISENEFISVSIGDEFILLNSVEIISSI